MIHELQKMITDTLEASTALTTALGNVSQISYGWPTGRPTITSDLPVALFWGADITSEGKRTKGNATGQEHPDTSVPFHLFAIQPDKLNTAADALIALWDEQTKTTTNYKVLRIRSAGDVSMFEPDADLYHRVVTIRFSQIWKRS